MVNLSDSSLVSVQFCSTCKLELAIDGTMHIRIIKYFFTGLSGALSLVGGHSIKTYSSKKGSAAQ